MLTSKITFSYAPPLTNHKQSFTCTENAVTAPSIEHSLSLSACVPPPRLSESSKDLKPLLPPEVSTSEIERYSHWVDSMVGGLAVPEPASGPGIREMMKSNRIVDLYVKSRIRELRGESTDAFLNAFKPLADAIAEREPGFIHMRAQSGPRFIDENLYLPQADFTFVKLF